MKLKLPKPLPYDFIDQMIDENIDFYDEPHEEEGYIIHFAEPRYGDYGSEGRSLFSLEDSIFLGDEQEYVEWSGWSGDAWWWTAKELTEDELEQFLARL